MRKTWAGKLLAMVLTGVTVMGTMPAYAVFAEEAQQGTTYYVSSENGDDANDGTSEKKALSLWIKSTTSHYSREIKFFWKKDLYLTISIFM